MEDLKGKLEKEFAKNSIVMLSVSGADYRNATSSLIDFSKRFRKTCYITLNDPSDVIRTKGHENLCFIDCVTATVKSTNERHDTIFISSPRALTEISIALKKAIEKFGPDSVIFDSISALFVYEKSVSALKFLHNIILTIRSSNMKAVFVVLKEDVSEEFMKDMSMFVDSVSEI